MEAREAAQVRTRPKLDARSERLAAVARARQRAALGVHSDERVDVTDALYADAEVSSVVALDVTQPHTHTHTSAAPLSKPAATFASRHHHHYNSASA